MEVEFFDFKNSDHLKLFLFDNFLEDFAVFSDTKNRLIPCHQFLSYYLDVNSKKNLQSKDLLTKLNILTKNNLGQKDQILHFIFTEFQKSEVLMESISSKAQLKAVSKNISKIIEFINIFDSISLQYKTSVVDLTCFYNLIPNIENYTQIQYKLFEQFFTGSNKGLGNKNLEDFKELNKTMFDFLPDSTIGLLIEFNKHVEELLNSDFLLKQNNSDNRALHLFCRNSMKVMIKLFEKPKFHLIALFAYFFYSNITTVNITEDYVKKICK